MTESKHRVWFERMWLQVKDRESDVNEMKITKIKQINPNDKWNKGSKGSEGESKNKMKKKKSKESEDGQNDKGTRVKCKTRVKQNEVSDKLTEEEWTK